MARCGTPEHNSGEAMELLASNFQTHIFNKKYFLLISQVPRFATPRFFPWTNRKVKIFTKKPSSVPKLKANVRGLVSLSPANSRFNVIQNFNITSPSVL